MNKKLAILGAGGHGKVLGEIAELNKYDKIEFFDDRVNNIKSFPYIISGNLDLFKKNINSYNAFFVAIGDNHKRFEVISWLKDLKVELINLIHPKSIVSKFSSLGEGTCVMANAVINPGTLIKNGVIINTSASIDHDCVVEDFAHISPNCSLSGSVKIGKLTHVGTGTSIHPGVNIGNNVKIAVGSKVYKNILDDTIHKN